MSVRVLVTGATGFTGQRVVRALIKEGHAVTAFVRSTSRFDVVANLGVPARIGDLGELGSLERAIEGQDAVVNVASLGTGLAPTIVAALQHAGIRRAVFFSTSAVRTALPSSSKELRLAAEAVVMGGEVGATLLRPTMIYGAPGDRNVERLIRFVGRWSIVPVPGSGDGFQQPVHVEDLAAAAAAILGRADLAGRDFDVAGPQPLTYEAMVRTVASVLGKQVMLVHVPPLLARAGAATLAFVRGRPVVTGEQILRLAEDKTTDIRTAAAAFRFEPRSFEQGVREEAVALRLLDGDRR